MTRQIRFSTPRNSTLSESLEPQTFESAIDTLSSRPEELLALRQLRQAVDFLSRHSSAGSRRKSTNNQESSDSTSPSRKSMNLATPRTFQVKRKPVGSFLDDPFESKRAAALEKEVYEAEEIAGSSTLKEVYLVQISKSAVKNLRRKPVPSYFEGNHRHSSPSSSSSSSSSSISPPSTPELTSTSLRSRSSRSSISSLEEESDGDLSSSMDSSVDHSSRPVRPLRNENRLPLQQIKVKELPSFIFTQHSSNLIHIPPSETGAERKRQGMLFYSQYSNPSSSSIHSSCSDDVEEVFLDALSQL